MSKVSKKVDLCFQTVMMLWSYYITLPPFTSCLSHAISVRHILNSVERLHNAYRVLLPVGETVLLFEFVHCYARAPNRRALSDDAV